MNVTVRIDFKAEDQALGRVYTVCFPAILGSNDGCLETKNGILKATTIEGMIIICYGEENKDAKHYEFKLSQ